MDTVTANAVEQLVTERQAIIRTLAPVIVRQGDSIRLVSADPETVIASVQERDGLIARLVSQSSQRN